MVSTYFNKKVLGDLTEMSEGSGLDFSKREYYIKREGEILSCYIEICEERISAGEIREFLERDDLEISEDEILILGLLSGRMGIAQSVCRIGGLDIDILLERLSRIDVPVIFDEERIKISDEILKLETKLDFEGDELELKIKNVGRAVFGGRAVFFLQDKVLFPLDKSLPISFYKEILNGRNRFRIDDILSDKDTLLPAIKQAHNLEVSSEAEKLFSMKMEVRPAKIVAELGKTSHFITIELKYEAGDELLPVNIFKYAETAQWTDINDTVKVLRNEKELLRYVSNLELSSEYFDEILRLTRMRSQRSSQNPFLLSFPISGMESVMNKIIPEISKDFEIRYKEGAEFGIKRENVFADIDSRFESRINLFSFKIRFRVCDNYIDIDDIAKILSEGKRQIEMKDGNVVLIENVREINKWLEFLESFSFSKEDGEYKAPLSAGFELDEFIKDMCVGEFKKNEEYKKALNQLKDKIGLAEDEIPAEARNILRKYQIEGVSWMYFLRNYGFGGILADEMGLGKTIQALTMMAMARDKTHLVVCPKSLMYNWEAEIKKYFPSLTVLVVDKDSEKRRHLLSIAKKYNIIITSYSLLQKDYEAYHEMGLEFSTMVLDEAHYVKNMHTLSSKAVRTIKAGQTLLLTGTPIENNLEELFAAFELVMPGYLGSKLDFRKDFASKIERNNSIALEILQARIRPFILRRTKDEVLKELPGKVEQVVFNEMTNKQIALYLEVLKRVKADVESAYKKYGAEKARMQVLSALLRLRQICNHPGLIDDRFSREDDISGKYEQFLEILEEVVEGGQKVLVFSQFTSMLNIFEKDLEKMGISFLRLDGSTKNRQELVDSFNNDPEYKVFLISLKAGGVGLNLTSASSVFLYDPWWNPMAERQAVDRAHRIGQTKQVHIYKFITKNSIEEKILKLQERKGNLFENLVESEGGNFRKLEWDDLMELFD